MVEKHQKTKPPTSPTPTTFIQTDANTFRELVQKMTGSVNHCCEKPATSTTSPRSRRPPFKLQQRRNTMRRLELELRSSRSHRCIENGFSPIHSPVTPLRGAEWSEEKDEEEKAIAEKLFYLHPSLLSTPRGSNNPPELLTLFPLTSPCSDDA